MGTIFGGCTGTRGRSFGEKDGNGCWPIGLLDTAGWGKGGPRPAGPLNGGISGITIFDFFCDGGVCELGD